MSYLSSSGADPNNLGYFATEAALEAAFPVGYPGAFAIVGDTDTVWVWDEDTMQWVDTGAAPGGGYTNLTQFVNQTPWRVFYSDANGDVQELALGANGEYLKSNGATSVPSWAAPGGSGTVTTVSVVTANGFAGTVVNATTTPAITITTSINSPVLAGNGTALIAATTTGSGSTVVLNNTPTITTPVLNGIPTGTGVATTATVSTLALRDVNGNISAVNLLKGYSTTVTAAGTTTLTVASNYNQYFTGTTTQTVVMPVTSTLVLGQEYWIVNRSTAAVTINSSGGNAILILAPGTSAVVTCILTSGTTAASWDVGSSYFGMNVATGKRVTFNHSITFAGTDSTTMTFPTTNATIARTDAAQTFTGVQSMTSPAITTGITAVGASFALINTVSTTVNFAGAATTLTVGGTPSTAITHSYSANPTATATVKTVNLATAGVAGSTTNVNIGSAVASAILGTLSLNFPTILTANNNTTVSLWDTNSTTITFAGAATTLTLAYNSTAASTTNISTGAVAAATTKTVNIATGGAASSTTNVNIGSANGGTTTVNSLIISLGGTSGVVTLGSIEIGAATDTTITRSAAGQIAVEGIQVLTATNAVTTTNKRIQPRTASSTTSSNLSPDLATANVYYRTTQTATLTIDAPTGTPVIGETIMIYVDSAGAQTLTINATYIPFGAAFPATTTAGKTFMMSAQYNGTNWKTLWANQV